MRWRVLGPLEVLAGQGWTGVDAPKRRAVLAALLAEPGQVVPATRLIDELWGDDPPPGARKLVSGYVLKLRRLLGDPGGQVLATQAPGYRLVADQAEVDAGRFGELVAQGRAALADDDAERAGDLLAAALALWRGPALADVPRGPLAAAEADRLEEARLTAVELRIEAGLRQGQGAELVPELRRLTSAHPLRERFWQLLIRALAGSGRQAEALTAYEQARRVIAAELGVDPGPDLRRWHQRLLADGQPRPAHPGDGGSYVAPPPWPERRPAAGTAVIPRQLPGTVRHFVGREAELRQLSQLLDELCDDGGAVVVSAIGGTAGVGKTALAVHWAHRAAGRFPDGQLYVNLRGYDPGEPMPAADALAAFLSALGVPSRDIPAGTDERAARYRSLLAGRRMLIVLDNAGSVQQVRPLLPGTSACVTLVTSRDSLAGLVARDGARRLDLDLLPAADAEALLGTLIGDRAAADPAATTALATQCARLPLALRVAAELAAARPDRPLASLVTELADRQRLDLLAAHGDPGTEVRAVFSWSCRSLEPGADLKTGGHCDEAVSVHTHALQAARDTSDPTAETNALNCLGSIDVRRDRFPAAANYFRQALALRAETSAPTEVATTLHGLGCVHSAQAHYELAAGYFRQALTLNHDHGYRSGEALVLGSLGDISRRQGNYRQATRYLMQGLALCRDIADRTSEAYVLACLGAVELRQGR